MRWVISPTHLPPACAALSGERTGRAPAQPPGAASGSPVPEDYAAEDYLPENYVLLKGNDNVPLRGR